MDLDLVRGDLLPPILIRDMHRDAERRALVHQAAAHSGWRSPALLTRFSAALMLAGCRMQATGQRLTTAPPLGAAIPCGCGA